MAIGKKINVMQTLILGGILTASVYIVSYLFGLLKLGEIAGLFATVPAVSAITGTLGQKVLGFVSGVGLDLSGVAFLPILISAMLVVWLVRYCMYLLISI